MKEQKYLKYLNEKEEQFNESSSGDGVFRIFFSDLSNDAQTRLLEGLQEDDEMVDIWDDEIEIEWRKTFNNVPLIKTTISNIIKDTGLNLY